MPQPYEDSKIPLIIALAEDPDTRGYEEGIQLNRLVAESYDTKSQISVIPAHAGTHLTYCSSGTGYVWNSDTDQKSDDT